MFWPVILLAAAGGSAVAVLRRRRRKVREAEQTEIPTEKEDR